MEATWGGGCLEKEGEYDAPSRGSEGSSRRCRTTGAARRLSRQSQRTGPAASRAGSLKGRIQQKREKGGRVADGEASPSKMTHEANHLCKAALMCDERKRGAHRELGKHRQEVNLFSEGSARGIGASEAGLTPRALMSTVQSPRAATAPCPSLSATLPNPLCVGLVPDDPLSILPARDIETDCWVGVAHRTPCTWRSRLTTEGKSKFVLTIRPATSEAPAAHCPLLRTYHRHQDTAAGHHSATTLIKRYRDEKGFTFFFRFAAADSASRERAPLPGSIPAAPPSHRGGLAPRLCAPGAGASPVTRSPARHNAARPQQSSGTCCCSQPAAARRRSESSAPFLPQPCEAAAACGEEGARWRIPRACWPTLLLLPQQRPPEPLPPRPNPTGTDGNPRTRFAQSRQVLVHLTVDVVCRCRSGKKHQMSSSANLQRYSVSLYSAT